MSEKIEWTPRQIALARLRRRASSKAAELQRRYQDSPGTVSKEELEDARRLAYAIDKACEIEGAPSALQLLWKEEEKET